MEERSFQDYYPEEMSYCYGCGRSNDDGLHIKSYWEGEESVARFTPRHYHTALPGFVYGGLLASLIDCHGVGTAAAATCRAEGRAMDAEPGLRFVTASLKVDYVNPTPIGVQLEARGKLKEIGKRKAVVSVEVFAEGILCARGEVIAVRMPESMKQKEAVNSERCTAFRDVGNFGN